jgi:hypothetical protein
VRESCNSFNSVFTRNYENGAHRRVLRPVNSAGEVRMSPKSPKDKHAIYRPAARKQQCPEEKENVGPISAGASAADSRAAYTGTNCSPRVNHTFLGRRALACIRMRASNQSAPLPRRGALS